MLEEHHFKDMIVIAIFVIILIMSVGLYATRHFTETDRAIDAYQKGNVMLDAGKGFIYRNGLYYMKQDGTCVKIP